MKRALIIIAATLACTTATAQVNPLRFTIEVAAGLTRYYNYSALSLVEDSKDTYTAPTLSLTFGIRDDTKQFGLRYRQTNVRTSALSLRENVTVHEVSLLYQRSMRLTPKTEMYVGASTGLTILQNNLAAVGINGTRYGINTGVEAGLRYYVSDYSYLSLTAGIDATGIFVSQNRVPDGYDPQTGRILASGHGLGGICIGIPPKVKKIKMPAALIIEGDGPILACYN